MSAKASYYKIGLFVIAATALIVLGVVAMGAGAFMQNRVVVETYFDETVQGLDVGSKVKYRGVEIGNVSEITLASNAYEAVGFTSEDNRYVVVRVALKPNVFAEASEDAIRSRLQTEIERGLRVQLALQGLTGSAYLEVNYHEPPPPIPRIGWTPSELYMPSAPSIVTRFTDSLDEVLRTLESADIEAIGENIARGMQSLADATSAARVEDIGRETVGLLREVRETNRRLAEVVEEMALPKLTAEAAGAVTGARDMIQGSAVKLDRILAQFEESSMRMNEFSFEISSLLHGREVNEALKGAAAAATNVSEATADLPETVAALNRTLLRIDRTIATQSRELESILDNFQSASRDLKEMTANAKRYPAATLWGAPPRPSDPGKPPK
jgi:ABC-type transporter Mla subunit MlaD